MKQFVVMVDIGTDCPECVFVGTWEEAEKERNKIQELKTHYGAFIQAVTPYE